MSSMRLKATNPDELDARRHGREAGQRQQRRARRRRDSAPTLWCSSDGLTTNTRRARHAGSGDGGPSRPDARVPAIVAHGTLGRCQASPAASPISGSTSTTKQHDEVAAAPIAQQQVNDGRGAASQADDQQEQRQPRRERQRRDDRVAADGRADRHPDEHGHRQQDPRIGESARHLRDVQRQTRNGQQQKSDDVPGVARGQDDRARRWSARSRAAGNTGPAQPAISHDGSPRPNPPVMPRTNRRDGSTGSAGRAR